jgi:hypothetical protein
LNPVTFVDEMYQNGAQGYFDALSFHPYQYTTPFSAGGIYPDSQVNQLADIRDLMVANGDAGKTIWASEYGEPTSVAGDAQQAAYLQDMLTTWRTLNYTGPAFVYTLEDDQTGSTNPEDTLGLIRDDGTWKPAAYIVRDLATSPATTPTMDRMALAMPQTSLSATVAGRAVVARSDSDHGGRPATVGRPGRSPDGARREAAPAATGFRGDRDAQARPNVRPTSRGRRGQTTGLPRRARDRMSHR